MWKTKVKRTHLVERLVQTEQWTCPRKCKDSGSPTHGWKNRITVSNTTRCEQNGTLKRKNVFSKPRSDVPIHIKAALNLFYTAHWHFVFFPGRWVAWWWDRIGIPRIRRQLWTSAIYVVPCRSITSYHRFTAFLRKCGGSKGAMLTAFNSSQEQGAD